jgi:hypothetical protein
LQAGKKVEGLVGYALVALLPGSAVSRIASTIQTWLPEALRQTWKLRANPSKTG